MYYTAFASYHQRLLEITTNLIRAAEIADLHSVEVHIEEAQKVVAAIKAPWKEHRDKTQQTLESLVIRGDSPEAKSLPPGMQVLCARDCLPGGDEYE